MKRLEKILVNVVGTIIAIYATIVLLFSLPFMQDALASWTADVLSKQLKAPVEIGSINLGLLNRVIVNDIKVCEPSGEPMMTIARASANINLMSLLSGNVNIGTAQLFGAKATLYKQTSTSKPNYQFIIDAFATEKDEDSSEMNLHIGSFIMRHAYISYDIHSQPVKEGNIDINHLHLHDCGMNVVVRCLTNDSLNVGIRRLQAKELVSGLLLKDTQLKLVGNKQQATLSDLSLSLPHSHLELDSLQFSYGSFSKDSTFCFAPFTLSGNICPSDFSPLNAKLKTFYDKLNFSITCEGNEQTIHLKNFRLESEDNNLQLLASANMQHPLHPQLRNIDVNIDDLQLYNAKLLTLANAFMPDHQQERLLTAVDDVAFSGKLRYTHRGDLFSDGTLMTGLGNVGYDLTLDAEHWLTGTINGDSIHLGKLQGSPLWGTTSFALDMTMNLNQLKPFPTGRVTGDIYSLHYNNYNYQNIVLNAQSTSAHVEGTVKIDDENLKAHATLDYTDSPAKDISLTLLLDAFKPNQLGFTHGFKGENVALYAQANLQGTDFEHLYGHIALEDVNVMTETEQAHLNGISLDAKNRPDGKMLYMLTSDMLTGHIHGKAGLVSIAKNFGNQLALHMPILFKQVDTEPADITYELTLTDAPILHHFTDADYSIEQPVRISGNLNSTAQTMSLTMNAPCLTYNTKQYDNVAIVCRSNLDNMNVHAIASTFQESTDSDTPSSSAQLDLMADVHDNRIVSDLYLNTTGRNNITLQLLPIVQLSDSAGNMKTDIALRQSSAVINDTTWTVAPAHIALYKKNIECRNVKFYNNTNSFLAIDGKASEASSDSLVATLNKLEIQYFLSMVDFDAVRFAGKASGRVIVNKVLGGGTPDLRANLHVDNLTIQEGPLGSANINAHWDKDVEGIRVDGRMIDLYRVPDALTGREKNITGITSVNGWISPAKNDMLLSVNTLNTNASFLHGFLRGVFKEVTGYVTGPVNIIGPFNNVNIIADAVPNVNLRLRATNVPYHIEGDTIRIRPYKFDFNDISIFDRFGHESKVNGQVTHRNMKNFAYHFNADLKELLAYDETEFNSDKFLATVFTDGSLTIDGSDGHPLYVNAIVTPTRGSVFAYDAATPDAITGNTFIQFRDRDSIMAYNPHFFDHYLEDKQTEVKKDSLTIVKEAKKNYNSDIFINFDINLTPACEVKLRMDNIEDGYMRTFGNAQITAQWYNKGSFQMFGNYNISSGSYRLYLQDIIFRDLALQPGSMVEFNGNPFDANIHLICHHTINSVPLSDLTSTTAFSQNNKVKVICVLDITGKLGNMDFKFDMDIPNVNEETRQLVRSMINSEEEMNTQMIYLLGLGRFYPNEYARANGGNNSGQAVNSLLSSTLSGQINQMLSNMIGRESNWNFGSSLTTGEKGWDDLDVEGILEGRLLDERLLINGAFGYRDNALTNQTNFIGDFEVKWRLHPQGNLFVKAYNQTNDRYFTKATLNTQGIGLSWQHDFESIRKRLKDKENAISTKKEEEDMNKEETPQATKKEEEGVSKEEIP